VQLPFPPIRARLARVQPPRWNNSDLNSDICGRFTASQYIRSRRRQQLGGHKGRRHGSRICRKHSLLSLQASSWTTERRKPEVHFVSCCNTLQDSQSKEIGSFSVLYQLPKNLRSQYSSNQGNLEMLNLKVNRKDQNPNKTNSPYRRPTFPLTPRSSSLHYGVPYNVRR